jgi:hypothetical protein
MPSPSQDLLWPDAEHRMLARDLAELAGMTEAELLELIDCGALTPDAGVAGEWAFSMRSVTVARTARRLREEFELEPHGVALLLTFVRRIRELEQELRDLRARLPR